MTINITSSKELFDKWVSLSLSLRSFAAIVQNDMVIDSKDVIVWEDTLEQLIGNLHDLRRDTLRHIDVYGDE
jgi:hypothetical protein